MCTSACATTRLYSSPKHLVRPGVPEQEVSRNGAWLPFLCHSSDLGKAGSWHRNGWGLGGGPEVPLNRSQYLGQVGLVLTYNSGRGHSSFTCFWQQLHHPPPSVPDMCPRKPGHEGQERQGGSEKGL